MSQVLDIHMDIDLAPADTNKSIVDVGVEDTSNPEVVGIVAVLSTALDPSQPSAQSSCVTTQPTTIGHPPPVTTSGLSRSRTPVGPDLNGAAEIEMPDADRADVEQSSLSWSPSLILSHMLPQRTCPNLWCGPFDRDRDHLCKHGSVGQSEPGL